MATFAIGDIHGCATSLETLLEEVDLSGGDLLVVLGDYVDRGPDSKRCIDVLLDLETRFQVKFLRGNHEVMMMEARSGWRPKNRWLGFGGREALLSYGTKTLEELPSSHWDFLEATLPYYETEGHIFVHASIDPGIAMENQSEWDLYWGAFDGLAPHVSGKTMICGHSSQKSGVPLSYGHAICIDTFAYGGQWLTCLNVETNHYIQANENGGIRRDVIEISTY